MKDLKIESTRNTPNVEFLENGNLSINGKAFSEDPSTFFGPLVNWVKDLESQQMNFEIKMEYLNTSATKFLSEIIRTIDANNKISNKEIKWYFEEDDEEMLELGQIIEEVTYSSTFLYKSFIEL